MKKLRLLLVLTAFIFSACGTSQLIGSLQQIPNPDEVAEIYLIRSKSMVGFARMIIVELDGEKLLKIGPGKYTRINVAADEYNQEHSLGACPPKGSVIDLINLVCKPGEKYYFLINITEEEGNQLIEKSKIFK